MRFERSEHHSPNFPYLGPLWADLDSPASLGIDRLARVQIETNATTVTKLARFMREREALS